MKLQRVLLDSGPFVALLSKYDTNHVRCRAELATVHWPLFTCWPVVIETLYLIRRDLRAVDGLFESFRTGLCALLSLDASVLPWLESFMRRYRNINAQIADGAIVYLAERERISTVFTLDRRDFRIYRYGKNRTFNIIPRMP